MNLCWRARVVVRRARTLFRWRPRPLSRRQRIELCVEEIQAAGVLTRTQRNQIIFRWSRAGDVHDFAHVAHAIYRRLGVLVDPPRPRRHA